ncbi:MAG: tyrosine-type recombinase/integrase [Deltaproteobacteria bacterium]|nr:tyrosine-type recombinase/integrase [Deltaproteobacteria bacterium]
MYAEMVLEKMKQEQRSSYIEKLKQHGRDYVLKHLGADRDIDSVEAYELEAFKSWMLNQVDSTETVNRVLTSMRQMFNYAARQGVCDPPRMPKNFPVRMAERTERWQILPPAEVARVIGLLSEDAQPALIYLANIGGRTGMAPAVRRSMCDFTTPGRPRVHYPATVMKSRKKLTVELNDAAFQALMYGLATHGDTPFPLRPHQLRDRWRDAREAAGYPKLRIHDLRHSRISSWIQAQVPLHVVRDLAGHCSLVVTNWYAHSTDEARHQASQLAPVDLGLRVPTLDEDV